MAYEGSVDLISGIRAKNNGTFPLVNAPDVRIDDNTRLSDFVQSINNKEGSANGFATLDQNGKVPSSQLPSYVDDVLEYANQSSFPITGESGKIYVDKSTNKSYRWSGSQYIFIASDLALGETSSTAYRGDRGKTAYDHASAKGSAYSSGLYKITTNDQGHVTAATAATNSDIAPLVIDDEVTGIGGMTKVWSAAKTTNELSEKVDDRNLFKGVKIYDPNSIGSESTIEINHGEYAHEVGTPYIVYNSSNRTDAMYMSPAHLPTANENDLIVYTIKEYIDLHVRKTTTVNGHPLSSNVTVTKEDLGLGNVDNTSDVNKPISIAQQAALDQKAPIASPNFTGSISLGRDNSSTVGNSSVAVGSGTKATGDYSHAEGYYAAATARSAHAEGENTVASGVTSHAEGSFTTASGVNSHAEGFGTKATHRSQHVFGEYSIEDDSENPSSSKGNYVEIVGNGLMNDSRSNARTLDWDGNERLKGDLYTGCNDDSTGGTKLGDALAAKASKANPEFTGTLTLGSTAMTETQLKELYSNDEDFKSVIFQKNAITISNASDNYWNTEAGVGGTAVKTSLNSYFYAANPISVTSGEIYEVKACQGPTNKARVWVTTDNDYNIITMAENNNGQNDVSEIITIPSGATLLLLTTWNPSQHPQSCYKLNDRMMKDYGLLNDLGYTNLLYCNKFGIYRTGASYVSSITDLPDGYNHGAFNLFVTNPAFANENFALQKLVAIDNSTWTRVIRKVNGSWSVYSIYDWTLIYDANDDFIKKSEFEAVTYKYIDIVINNTIRYYWNTEAGVGGTAVKTSVSSTFYAANPIRVYPGEIYRLHSKQGATDKTRIWVVTDDEYNIIDMCDNLRGSSEYTVNFTVPEGGTLLLLTTQDASIQTLEKKVLAFDEKSLKGKKLSLLGDSISAYTGTVPSRNDVYYDGSRSGVKSPDQMWWKVLCNLTGMEPLIIDGWSGSGINWQTDSSHVNKVPMSDDSRCKALHNGTTNPDVIIIAGGVNDYSYAEAAQNEPLEWDGITVPGYTEPSTGKIVYNSFTEAYAALIMKLQTQYPDAIVVALSTWFTKRGTDTGFTFTHTVGSGASAKTYTQQDYNDKIKYVAERFHIPYIDVSNIGINRNNMYPTYAIDSADIPTHPNAKGQALMGKAISEKIVSLINAYFTL